MTASVLESYSLSAGANTVDIMQGTTLEPGMVIKVSAIVGDAWILVVDNVGFPTEPLNGMGSSQVGFCVKQGKDLTFTYRGQRGKVLAGASASSINLAIISVGVL